MRVWSQFSETETALEYTKSALDKAESYAKIREDLVEAKTALLFTEKALEKAEHNVTVAHIREQVVPMLQETGVLPLGQKTKCNTL